MAKHEDALRCMALGDERFIRDVLAMPLTNVDASDLDPKTHALVRLGALIALDASPSSFQWNAATALASGATVDEIVGVLMAVAQTVGLARVASAAPAVALALGYDIDAALEAHDEGGRALEAEHR
jgi:alkylhydroperoxidase/carboxymuconolactone decarboxylase family protein YurZ